MYYSGVMSDIEYTILTQWFDHVIKQYQVKVDLVGKLLWSPKEEAYSRRLVRPSGTWSGK